MTNADPENVNARLYKQISKLLDDLERPPKTRTVKGKTVKEDGISMRERIAALIAIGRIQTIFMGLRRGDSSDDNRTGSAVRRYQTAFKDAGRGRKAGGPVVVPEPEPDPIDDAFTDDDRDDDTA